MSLVQWNVFDSTGDTSYEEASDSNGGCASGVQHRRLPLRPLAVARPGAGNVGDHLPVRMSTQRGNQRSLLRAACDDDARAGNLRTGAAIALPCGSARNPARRTAETWPPPGCAACRAPAALS